jgi:hypothetical protein
MLSTLAPRVRLWAVVGTLVIAGCGGGGSGAETPAGGDGGGGDAQPTAGEQNGEDRSGATVGAATLTADPSSAWAEVDGGRLEYRASGGIAFECTVADDRVIVNFQSGDGHDLLLQGSNQTGSWILSLTFKPGDKQIQYGASTVSGAGSFGISDGTVSYEGKVDRIEDFDLANATEVDARVAINCASAAGGGDPTATVGGQEYLFALSGAQSVTCEVAPERVEIRIDRLGIDDTQLEIDGRQEGDRWIGAAVVYTSDGSFTSTFLEDGTGLTIDGSSVEYAGTFKGPDGGELDGTASVTCP